MPPGKDQQSPKGDVLADHQPEFGDFSGAEMLAQFCPEGRIRRAKIQSHLLGEANGQSFPGFEAAVRLGEMNLGDGFLVESLTRRRRVPGEESGIALVDGRHLQPGQLLDARGYDAFGMAGAEERKEALEMFGDQLQQVHGASFQPFSGR